MSTRLRVRLPAFDGPLVYPALGLVAVGLLMVFSATHGPGAHEGLWLRQLTWACAALAVAWIVSSVPFRVYDSLAYPAYVTAIVLLLLVLVMGSSAYGARRWLDLGPIKFQPSEIAKIATVLVLARRFTNPKLDLSKFGHWFPAVMLVAVPFVLVLKEPDLGTSLAFPVILVAMLFWAGLPLRTLVLATTPVLNAALFFLTGSLAWFAGLFAVILVLTRPRWPLLLAMLLLNGAVSYFTPHLWDGLADYQKRRIETFLEPGHDPFGAGYQIIQSQIAIGSGGVTGKGFLEGTQKELAFLPMRHTDFIYSVVGEELGLLGSLTVVILYVLLIRRGLRIAVASRNGFASLMAVGLVTALFYHIMVNMLMTIGWAPVTGLPLPLLSYGGTALIVNGIGIGLLHNVATRRQEL